MQVRPETKVRGSFVNYGKHHNRLHQMLDLNFNPELAEVIKKASEKKCKIIADWIERTSEQAIAEVLKQKKGS